MASHCAISSTITLQWSALRILRVSQFFAGATVRTLVLLTRRDPEGEEPTLYSPPLTAEKFLAVRTSASSVASAVEESAYEVSPEALSGPVWSFTTSDADATLGRLKRAYQSLAEYCEGQICRGVVSGLTKAFVIDERTRAEIIKTNPEAKEIIKPFLNGRDVRRYRIDRKDTYLIYTYHGIEIAKYPAVEQHLRPFRDHLEKRATKQEWYELQQPQFRFARYMDEPKIIFPDIAKAPRFALDETGYYGSNKTYFIPRRDLYLLGLLNSRLGEFYFVITCAGLEGKEGIYLRFFGQYLEGFPVRTIDFSDPEDMARYDRMVELVQRMLELHERLEEARIERERTVIGAQIEATDRQIDRLVYELYGLTEDEIAVVEGRERG